jgi:hypothetical protein
VSTGFDAALLGDNPDPLAQRALPVLRIEAEHVHLAGSPSPMSFEDLDDRRLARPVRAEEPEHLASSDRQINARDGLERPVRLAQAANRHREVRGVDSDTKPRADAAFRLFGRPPLITRQTRARCA